MTTEKKAGEPYRIKSELAFLENKVDELERELSAARTELKVEEDRNISLLDRLEKLTPDARKQRSKRMAWLFALLSASTIVGGTWHLAGAEVGKMAAYVVLGLVFTTLALAFATEAS